MNEEQQRFFELMRRCQCRNMISGFFDQTTRTCDLPAAKKAVKGNILTNAEKVMLAFFVNVWRGKDELKFSITDAAGLLDEHNRQLVIGWLNRPFWP